jgi:DNA-binding NarL/FixJ family response regulator
MVFRVVVAEDDLFVREGLVGMIGAAPELELVGVGDDVESLSVMVEALRPDVVITAVGLPPTWTDERVGFATALRMGRRAIGVVVLSRHASAAHARGLLADGAAGRGYVLKDSVADPGELLRIVRQIAVGGSYLEPELLDLVVTGRNGARAPLDLLTRRELQVVELVAAGHSNRVIAGQLSISIRGVERHLNSIYRKLDLASQNGTDRRVKAALLYLEGRSVSSSA